MHSWIVSYTLIDLVSDEKTVETEVILTEGEEGQQLSEVEKVISQIARGAFLNLRN
jgi:hypothetical protein